MPISILTKYIRKINDPNQKYTSQNLFRITTLGRIMRRGGIIDKEYLLIVSLG